SSLLTSSAPPTSHSFPTRRSSDLTFGMKYHAAHAWLGPLALAMALYALVYVYLFHFLSLARSTARTRSRGARTSARERSSPQPRSEEHTSELQSRVDLVCRLLLEK